MSYDNFRNEFWNPSTFFDSGSQQMYSFYLKKVVIYCCLHT